MVKIYEPFLDLNHWDTDYETYLTSNCVFTQYVYIKCKSKIGDITIYRSKQPIKITNIFLDMLKKIAVDNKYALLNCNSSDEIIKDICKYKIYVIAGENIGFSKRFDEIYKDFTTKPKETCIEHSSKLL